MFRKANKTDSALIVEFIRALGEYENRLEAVKVNEELINKWIFEEKMANVVFIMEDNKEVGFALYYYNFSTFKGQPTLYLEDLYVRSEYRANGYGKQLIKYVASIAKEAGCKKMSWSCLDWNESSINFYKRLNAKIVEGNLTFELNESGIEDLIN